MKKILLWHLLSLFMLAEENSINNLYSETSPYLQQHLHNPVNWYPWGKRAFEKAKKENKLIFLSIGYSTCHWCHVMEEESFTDEKIAKLLNDDFISIKVDREEYPQIDKKYQQLYMDAKGKRGGWPLSVFLSPSQEVFYLGTYIPKEAGYGSEGLENMLPSFVQLYKKKHDFDKAIKKYKSATIQKPRKVKIGTKIVGNVVDDIAKQYDIKNGGFSSRPKFPEASKLALLLDIHRLEGSQKALEMAENTLRKMAKSGLYDQIGGGFFRYTVDASWQTPHFEKMLYTNAELIAVYVKLYEMRGDKLYKKVVDESIAQMEKNFVQEGLYLSASDADSDGEEGGYFIYEYAEVKSALVAKGWKLNEIEDTLAYLGIEEDGNIDGDFSHVHITGENEPARLEEVKRYLRSVRAKRTFPFVDKKINTAWASMMVKALFVASKLESSYLPLATKRFDALLKLMRQKEVLYHQTFLGQKPRQKALLEDYAFLIDALIVAYDRTYKEAYLSLAQTLADETLSKFYKNRRWLLSDDGIEAFADFDDRYYTAALSQLLEDFVRLSSLTENLTYNDVVKQTIQTMGAVLESSPADAPKLVHVYLRLQKGDVLIHAKKNKLLLAQKTIDKITYPFLLSSTQESDEYLACKVMMCFAHDKHIDNLIKKIDTMANAVTRKWLKGSNVNDE